MQNLLRELEFKKPQLDELVNTAESLKTDANKLQLQSKGKCIDILCYFIKTIFIGSGMNVGERTFLLKSKRLVDLFWGLHECVTRHMFYKYLLWKSC